MKTRILLPFLLASLSGMAQNAPIDFENTGFGSNWTWTVFENDINPPLEIVTNPDPSGINSSATVAKFIALEAGQPWAGVESAQGADLGEFVLGPTNRIIKIKVWKSVISDVGIKLVSSTFWSQGELKVANTVMNQWEELTFDFSGYINPPTGNGTLNQIVIFTDFNARGKDNVTYFDDIQFTDGVLSSNPNSNQSSFSAFPNPTSDQWTLHGPWNEGDQLRILDVQGRCLGVFFPKSAEPFMLDATAFQPGLYLAQVSTGMQQFVLRLSKN